MKFTLYSNKFIVGEVLTKTELEEKEYEILNNIFFV